MRKLTRKNLDELAIVMPVLSEIQQREFLGGYQPSCVFNVYDYLDGNRYSANHYFECTKSVLNYEPKSNGAVSTADIEEIGSFGDFRVNKMTTDFTFGPSGTIDGLQAIMSFNVNGTDHLVVVEKVESVSGSIKILYYDPTSGLRDYKYSNEVGGYWSVEGPINAFDVNPASHYESGYVSGNET